MDSQTSLSSPLKQRKKPIGLRLWEQHRTVIENLYVEEKKTLSETRATMENDYSFRASEKQYKDKIKAWGWAKKISSSDNRFMLKKERHRITNDGKKTAFWVRGSYASPRKLRRSVARQPARYNKALSPLADTPPYIRYRTPCRTPSGNSPAPEQSKAKRSTLMDDCQPSIELESSPAASEGHDADGEQPVNAELNSTKNGSFEGVPTSVHPEQFHASEHPSQDLPTVVEELSSEEGGLILFVEPMLTGGKRPYPEEKAAESSRFKEFHTNQLSNHHSTREDYLLGAFALGDSITQVSSRSDELGSGVFYLGGNGLEDEAFSKILQEAESFSDRFFQIASSFDNRGCDMMCAVRDPATPKSGSSRTISSLDQTHKTYDRLLGGYEHLLRLNNRSRFQASADLLALDLPIDPMADDWQFVTQCCTVYGRVHRTHLQGTLHLISIYYRCGEWATFEALVTCLIGDLELALSIDGREIIAAARLLLLLCLMRAGTGCKEEWKWTDAELAETVFHRAIVFSKKLKYSCSFTWIQKALAALLYQLRKADEAQPLATKHRGAQIYRDPDWSKIAHLLFMATMCFEPGPESDIEEGWDFDDASEDGQSIEEPTTEQFEPNATFSDDDWLSRKHMQVLRTKLGLCSLFIRWRKFPYVEELLQELLPELETELPRRPGFAIDAFSELALQFAQARRWEDANREYTRARTAYEHYKSPLEKGLASENAVKEEGEKQLEDSGVHVKLQRVRETLEWGLAIPRSPSVPRSGTFQRLSLSPCEMPTWVW